MRTLYLDCGMGAAGDMLTAALLELLPEPAAFVEEFNALDIPGVEMQAEKAEKCGIVGTYVRVTVYGEEEGSADATEVAGAGEHEHSHEHSHAHAHDHEHTHGHSHEHEHVHEHTHTYEHSHAGDHAHVHAHSSLHDIEHLVNDHLTLPDLVRQDVLAVYQLIAEAESHVHGVPVTDIHFHEVGTMDALADVTAVCLLLHKLRVESIVASPVQVGAGHVHCAHGILPVPAPATAHILQGVPIYGGDIQGELCTPTGAALLKHFVTRFGNMPVMQVEAIGYGMGKKDFPRANCVRAMLGETAGGADEVLELSCNVDDMTAEQIGFALERLFAEGALDAFTTPIGMKKSRPGTLITVLARPEDREALVRAIFAHTPTLGVRVKACERHVLERRIETVETPLGDIRRKEASGYGVTRVKWEYDDVARIAAERGMSLAEVVALIENR